MKKTFLKISLLGLLCSSSVVAFGSCYTPCWNGFYLGGNLGGIFNNSRLNSTSFLSTNAGFFTDFDGRQTLGQFDNYSFSNSGITGGGQVGYNYQFAPNWVAGLETDLAYTSLKETKTRNFVPAINPNTGNLLRPSSETARNQLNWLGTLRPRIGIILTNNFLAYATGGFAYGRVQNSLQTTNVPNTAPLNYQVRNSSNTTQTGWTAGLGLEYLFACNWSAKAEYLYYDLGHQNRTLVYDAGNYINYKFTTQGHIVRVGLNYKFG